MKFEIRRVGEESWSKQEGGELWDAAEKYCEVDDENGLAFGPGIYYEIKNLETNKVYKIKVTASVTYHAYDVDGVL